MGPISWKSVPRINDKVRMNSIQRWLKMVYNHTELDGKPT